MRTVLCPVLGAEDMTMQASRRHARDGRERIGGKVKRASAWRSLGGVGAWAPLPKRPTPAGLLGRGAS